MAGVAQHRQLPVDVPKAHVHRFEQQDRTFEGRQPPPSRGGDRVLVATDQRTRCDAAGRERAGRLVGDGTNRDRFRCEDRLSERRCGCCTEGLRVPWRSVDAGHASVLQQGQVQDGDLAEAEQDLRVRPGRGEVQAIRNAVRAFPTPRREDRLYARVAERIVEIGEAVLVGPGHVAMLVEGVRRDLADEPKLGQHAQVAIKTVSCRRARRRHEPHRVTGLQPWRQRDRRLVYLHGAQVSDPRGLRARSQPIQADTTSGFASTHFCAAASGSILSPST